MYLFSTMYLLGVFSYISTQVKHFIVVWMQKQAWGSSCLLTKTLVYVCCVRKYMCAVLCLVAESYLTFCDPMDYSPPGSSVHGDSPGKNTGVGCHAHLQEIFPAQGSNPGLLHCMLLLYHLSHQGSPGILEWVACPFFRRSSWPRDRTSVSCIAGRFFTSWTKKHSYITSFIHKVVWFWKYSHFPEKFVIYVNM